jgi:hypothetical protein
MPNDERRASSSTNTSACDLPTWLARVPLEFEAGALEQIVTAAHGLVSARANRCSLDQNQQR